jgi:acetyl/propionyl-CoA carboxylase alpha subunit
LGRENQRHAAKRTPKGEGDEQVRVLIANRGEVAIRIARAAADLGLETVAVHATDDARSRHVLAADESVALDRAGPAAYLDAEALVAAALDAGCAALHPGYGFLSEDASFAERCADAGIQFVGPTPEVLRRLGDKLTARSLAAEVGVPVVEGTSLLESIADAEAFFARLDGAPMMLKAIAGGGGRGMRTVETAAEVGPAFERCHDEAQRAFGRGDLFAERYLPSVRHIEVQIIGDGHDVVHLGERECSLQRRHQKLIEVAPAPFLEPDLRHALLSAAVALGQACDYSSLGTVEFLVDETTIEPQFFFLEANPRLQVEHTVTEMVTGMDLVQTQLCLALAGATLAEIGLGGELPAWGSAIQLRVNAETIDADGAIHPAGGVLRAFEPPTGPRVRVDTFGYAGYETNPSFDSLLAKVIVHQPGGDLAAVLAKGDRALQDFRIDGIDTNVAFLRAILARPELADWDIDTQFVDANLVDLVHDASAAEPHRRFFTEAAPPVEVGTTTTVDAPVGTTPVSAPLRAVVVSIAVEAGDQVVAGQEVAVLEALKMQHVVAASASGVVRLVAISLDAVVDKGQPIVFVEETDDDATIETTALAVDLEAIRPDLAAVGERIAITLDDHRPDAVEKRHSRGLRTARENVTDLCDPDSFREYGQLTVAAQRRIRPLDELMERTPADGIITGLDQRRRLRSGAQPGGGTRLRLHRAGGHPRAVQPQEDRPPARTGPPVAAAGRVLHRGWRRAAGRHRLGGLHVVARHHDLRHLRQDERRRATHRHQLGSVLRRQRRALRLRRRHHRHPDLLDRHGRPGDDRGRWPGFVPHRRGRPHRRAGRQRSGRHRH